MLNSLKDRRTSQEFTRLLLETANMRVHLAESGDSVPRWVSRKCNMLPKSALLRLWRGSRGSIRYAKALLASKGRETHAGSQGSIDSTFA